MGKNALIFGITGQDGSYLAEFLLKKGYRVGGVIRRCSGLNTERLEHLYKDYLNDEDSEAKLKLVYGDLTDATSIRSALEQFKPDEVYNLAAQSHVGISFKNPNTTMDINLGGPLKILEAIRDMDLKCKYYQASSSEMFGVSVPPQNEDTPLLPQSPYAISKVGAFHLTKHYRKAYGMFAVNGILFNHESPRRGLNFVTKKITLGLAKILVGKETKLKLGNLNAKRDWGFAGEYVEAMWKMLQQKTPKDFVISTEETHTIRDFLKEVFSLVGLNYKNFVEISEVYMRPSEVPALLGDSSKAKRQLGWKPKVKFKELVKMMLVSDLKEVIGNERIIPTSQMKNEEDYLLLGRELANELKG